MKSAILILLALVALSGSVMAGIAGHATLGLPDGSTHTADVYANNDGTASVLVDGQLVGAPGVPSTPDVPSLPVLP